MPVDPTRYSTVAGRLAGALALFCFALAATAGASGAEHPRYLIELNAAPASEAAATLRHQDTLIGRMENELQREIRPDHRYRRVFSGLAVRLGPDEASAVARLEGVRRVTKDAAFAPERFELDRSVQAAAVAARRAGDDPLPDPVADLIGAPGVWDGSATGLAPTKGEGIVVAVVGPGINGALSSFAATGGDGFTHVNPLGSGVYLGECFQAPELTCNDKLIGRRTYAAPGINSEDESGYGSFVAAQAAGNRLFDLELTDVDGNPSGYVLDEVSGIAPHANIIAYRVCTTLCMSTDIIMALDQALDDGVDVLIHVVGSGDGPAWSSPYGLAFKALRAAGVSVTVPLGQQGPGYGTADGGAIAPWTASFASSTHGRRYDRKEVSGFSGGDTPPPQAIAGRGRSGGITAPVVDAADYPNPGDPGGDPAQCLQPYPAGTFNGEIVLCDRGFIPRFLKSNHVRDGGAGGIILANTSADSELLAADITSLPGIHVSAADGALLRVWLASGDDHVATLSPSLQEQDDDAADVLGGYDAMGPSANLDFLVPSLTAPALSVFGVAGPQLSLAERNGRGSHPGGGAIALLKSLHPDWTDAEILSALMTTAVTNLRDPFTLKPRDAFAYGGGRIDVAAAARAALVLDVGDADFDAANPLFGGDPALLNLAGLVETHCFPRCSWTRTVRATRAGEWRASAQTRDGDLIVRVAPETFSLADGEEQTLSVELDGIGANVGGIRFAEVRLEPLGVTTAPPAVLQVAVDLFVDGDGDGIANRADNCLELDNPAQRDSNGDGYGNRCDADLNNDGIVNSIDLGLMRARIGGSDADADLDGDGQVDGQDIAILRDAFYAAPGPSGVAPAD